MSLIVIQACKVSNLPCSVGVCRGTQLYLLCLKASASMAQSDETCASFDSMPFDVQLKIFQLLNNRERREVQLVSKTWRKLLFSGRTSAKILLEDGNKNAAMSWLRLVAKKSGGSLTEMTLLFKKRQLALGVKKQLQCEPIWLCFLNSLEEINSLKHF